MENDASLPGSRRAQLPTVPPHAAFPFQPCRDTITSHESPECTPSCPAGPLADIAITPEPPPASAQPSPAPRVPCPSPGTRGGAFGGCAPYPTPCGVFPGVLVAGECPPPPRLTSVCPSPCHPSDRPVCRAGTPAPKTGATPPGHPSEHWVGKAGPRRGRSKETDGRQGQTLYWSHAGGGDPQQASPLGWGRGVTGSGGGESPGRGGVPGCRPCGGSAAFLQAEAVKEVLAKAARGPLRPPGQAPQVGDVVSQRLDGLHLLVQVVRLEEVAELWGEGHQPGLGELHREGTEV